MFINISTCRHSFRSMKNLKYPFDNSVDEDSGIDYMHEIRRSKPEFRRPRSKPYALASCSSVLGLYDAIFLSLFHLHMHLCNPWTSLDLCVYTLSHSGMEPTWSTEFRSLHYHFQFVLMIWNFAGPKKTSPYQPSDADTYYSTFHETPERKSFSKEDWENFTKESTKKALEGLVSSPDFTKWAVANAERITLTPTDDSNGKMKGRQQWLNWLWAFHDVMQMCKEQSADVSEIGSGALHSNWTVL